MYCLRGEDKHAEHSNSTTVYYCLRQLPGVVDKIISSISGASLISPATAISRSSFVVSEYKLIFTIVLYTCGWLVFWSFFFHILWCTSTLHFFHLALAVQSSKCTHTRKEWFRGLWPPLCAWASWIRFIWRMADVFPALDGSAPKRSLVLPTEEEAQFCHEEMLGPTFCSNPGNKELWKGNMTS